MSDLVRYYKEYYREQTSRAFDDLFRCMLEYDFSSYCDDIKKIYVMHGETKCMGEFATLKSGGSTTGLQQPYHFGPNFDQIKFSVEGFLRLRDHKTILLADPGFGSKYSTRPIIDPVVDCPQYDLSISVDWILDSSIGILEDHLDRIYQEGGPVNISALPYLWLFLTNDPSFKSFALRNEHKINAFVNSDGLPMFNTTTCRTHDQMIDWASGTNFYQCDSGGYHFLPTFFCEDGRNSSLINLKRNSKSFDDSFRLCGDAAPCVCGRMAMRFSFLPHSANAPLDRRNEPVDFSNLPSLMWPGVYSFQVLQEAARTIVFYSCREGSESGLSRPIAFLEGSDIGKIELIRATYFMVGRKRQIFWRGGSPVFYDFFERRTPWQQRS